MPRLQKRYDAFELTQKAGIRWRWKGSRAPEPDSKPVALNVDGHRLPLDFNSKGWGATRVAWLAPCCGQRKRFVYELADGRLQCRTCAKLDHSSVDRWKIVLRRARTKMLSINPVFRKQGEELEALALANLLAVGKAGRSRIAKGTVPATHVSYARPGRQI